MTRTKNTLRSSLLAAFASTWLAACGGGGGGSTTPAPTSDAGAIPVASGSPAPAPAPSPSTPVAAGPSPSATGPAAPSPSGSSAPVAQGPAAPAPTVGGTPTAAPPPAGASQAPAAPAPAPATAVSLAQIGELWLTPRSAEVQRYAAAARLVDGTYVVVRENPTPGTSDSTVLVRRLDAQGNPVGVERVVAAGSRPGVTSFPDGRYLVTWLMPPPPTFTLTVGTGGQLFDAAGVPVGGVMSLGVATMSAQPTALVDGTFILAAFIQSSHVNGPAGVLRGFRTDGTSTGFVTQLQDDACGIGGNPSVTALPAGGFAVAWPHNCASAPPRARMRVYDGSGALAASSDLTVGALGESAAVSIATLTSGDIAMEWSTGAIQLREARTLVVAPTSLPTSADGARAVQLQGRTPLPVEALAGGGFLIPWAGTSESQEQVPVSRFSNAGEPL